ncbi:FtsH protease activity modulator HflK [Buchnera aphidicola]|uniref:FtsH protease activity modulator HflK n=1 Tax=Buchnera aphidicola TaxID=9 RepID=UPI003464ADBA
MVWNEPSDDKFNHDPWSKKDNKSNKDIKINRKNKIFSFNKKYFFSLFRHIVKNYGRNFNRFNNIKTSIFIILSLILLCSFFSGFYIIKENEKGVVIHLGKYSHVVDPGLHWRPILINKIKYIDVDIIREITFSNLLLSIEEKLLNIEINAKYKIVNFEDYLFSVENPDDNIRQIIRGVLYNIIGRHNIDTIFVKNNDIIKNEIKKEAEEKIRIYKLGISITDINLKKVCYPRAVQSSLNEIRLAYKNKQKYIKMSKNYANEVIFLANSKAQNILTQSKLYKMYKIEKSKSNIILFSKILHEYRVKKKIILEQIYIETIESILSHIKKILVDTNHNTILLIPLNNLLLNDYKFNLSPYFSSRKNIQLHSFLSIINNDHVDYFL